MKAAVLEARQRLVVREVPDPPLRPGHVAVAVRAVGICGTDLHVYLGTMEHRVRYPAIMGHEAAGVVLEAAADVPGLAPGDPVVVDIVIACGRCPRCAEGQLNVCENLNVLGIDSQGAMAERLVVPARMVHRYPRSLPLHAGIMVELYSVAVRAVRRTRPEPGDLIVLFGAGKVGLALLDVLRASRALTLVSVDVDPTRLAVARRLGADVVLNPRECDPVAEVRRLTAGRGADKAIEAVGHPVEIPGQGTPVQQAFQCIRSAGQVTVIGQGEQTEPVRWREFVIKEASVVTSRLNLGDFPRSIALLERGVLHPDALITHRLPLAAAPDAFARLAAHEQGMIKVVLEI